MDLVPPLWKYRQRLLLLFLSYHQQPKCTANISLMEYDFLSENISFIFCFSWPWNWAFSSYEPALFIFLFWDIEDSGLLSRYLCTIECLDCLFYENDSDIYGRKYTKLSYLVNGYGRVEGNISRKPLNMKSGLILTVEDYFFYAQIGNWQKILKSIKDNYDFRKSRIILRSESDFMRCRKSKKTELYYTSILFF